MASGSWPPAVGESVVAFVVGVCVVVLLVAAVVACVGFVVGVGEEVGV